jgi:KipI family sensor histidine kinase inhibitor
MELIAVGRTAVLAEVGDPAAALALALWARGRVAAAEVVPAARTVLFDGVDPGELREALAAWDRVVAPPEGELVEIAVTYDGQDLAPLADVLGVTADDLVARHVAEEHVVAFCGFSPGFGYALGSPFDVPRLATPRPRVERGSLGLAGPYTGIYPAASPGGWQLIGRTEVAVWDQSREEPALLAPGTRIRFVAA